MRGIKLGVYTDAVTESELTIYPMGSTILSELPELSEIN